MSPVVAARAAGAAGAEVAAVAAAVVVVGGRVVVDFWLLGFCRRKMGECESRSRKTWGRGGGCSINPHDVAGAAWRWQRPDTADGNWFPDAVGTYRIEEQKPC